MYQNPTRLPSSKIIEARTQFANSRRTATRNSLIRQKKGKISQIVENKRKNQLTRYREIERSRYREIERNRYRDVNHIIEQKVGITSIGCDVLEEPEPVCDESKKP